MYYTICVTLQIVLYQGSTSSALQFMLFDPTANTMQQEVGRIWATDKGRGLTSPHVTCSLDTPLAPILLHVPLAEPILLHVPLAPVLSSALSAPIPKNSLKVTNVFCAFLKCAANSALCSYCTEMFFSVGLAFGVHHSALQ